MTHPNTTTIIGAGITGLGAAHLLGRENAHSVIFESAAQPGGRAGYHIHDGFCYETGGKNFSSGHRIINGFLNEFGIRGRDVQHPGFHIVMDGKLRGFDKKRTLSGDLRMASALGVRGALQFRSMLSKAMRHASELNHESGKIEEFEARHDRYSIADTMARKLAYGPLRMFSIIAGAAEPEESYFSTLLLFLAGFKSGSHQSIPGGMVRLFDGLIRNKDVRFNTRVDKIVVRDNRVCALQIQEAGQRREVPTGSVLCTLPLHQLLGILDVPDEIRRVAEMVRYFPLAMVNAEYDQDVFSDQISSIMFDPSSHIGHCSANRLYQKNRIRFTLTGRRARTVLHLADDRLIELAEQDFLKYCPIPGKRTYFHVMRHPTGLCAYAPNYSRIRRILTEYFSTIQGLHIAGDYLDGHNMEGCLIAAERAVKHIVTRLPQPSIPTLALQEA